jgi:hypothetical protein
VEAAVAAARAALKRNRGRDWARAPGAVRAKYLRAIAAKVRTLLALLRAGGVVRAVLVLSFDRIRSSALPLLPSVAA